MRKLLTLLLVVPSISFAQKLFLKPEISAGFGGIKAPSILGPSSLFSYKAGVGIGYELLNFRLETGVAYFKTGYQFDLSHLTFEDQFDPTPNAKQIKNVEYHFNALLVPLKLSYAVNMGRFIRIVPTIGVAGFWKIEGHKLNSYVNVDGVEKGSLLRSSNKYNILATAGLHFEVPICKRISINAGPTLLYYLNPKPRSSWKQYGGLMDAGVIYKF